MLRATLTPLARTPSPLRQKASTRPRVALSPTPSAASAWSTSPSGQGVVYAWSSTTTPPAKVRPWCSKWAPARSQAALNVHCGHDDIYGALDTGWIMLMGKDAQQAADQALILRRVTELSLTPGMNIMDGFLTTHLERTFYKHESDLIREYLGAPEDVIDCPTEAQRVPLGPPVAACPR